MLNKVGPVSFATLQRHAAIKMWYPELGQKHISGWWRAMKYFSLIIYFSYVVAELKRLFYEYFAWMLRVTCSITVAIWLLGRFLNTQFKKKQSSYTFIAKRSKNQRGCICWNVTWHWQNIDWISLFGNVTWKCLENKLIEATISSSKVILQHSLLKIIHFFQLQMCYLIHPGLQYYCFFEQVKLYQLYELWQMPRQVWAIFFVQKPLQQFW